MRINIFIDHATNALRPTRSLVYIPTHATEILAQKLNFVADKRVRDGKSITDYKLSRFACYLIAMNGDIKTARCQGSGVLCSNGDCVSALHRAGGRHRACACSLRAIRSRKSLSGVARKAGVETYAFFKTHGVPRPVQYESLATKGIEAHSGRKITTRFYGSRRLAANLFRITQTELKIKTRISPDRREQSTPPKRLGVGGS